MDLETLKIAWTWPWISTWRCRAMIGLIRWSTGCRTAWVVRHCWLLVCLAHLRPIMLQSNIDQESFTLSVSWAILIFSNVSAWFGWKDLNLILHIACTTCWRKDDGDKKQGCLALYFFLIMTKYLIWYTLIQHSFVHPKATPHMDVCLGQMPQISCFT